MKFRERANTTFLTVVKTDIGGMTVRELFRIARKRGEFGVSFHYLVQDDGRIAEGRPLESIGGRDLDETEESIVVLLDSKGKTSDAQKVALQDILEDSLMSYPTIEAVTVQIRKG